MEVLHGRLLLKDLGKSLFLLYSLAKDRFPVEVNITSSISVCGYLLCYMWNL